MTAIIQHSGLSKHSEIRAIFQRELGLGYGNANSLMHFALQPDGEWATQARGLLKSKALDEIYSGIKAGLRPMHD